MTYKTMLRLNSCFWWLLAVGLMAYVWSGIPLSPWVYLAIFAFVVSSVLQGRLLTLSERQRYRGLTPCRAWCSRTEVVRADCMCSQETTNTGGPRYKMNTPD